jgi:negative regulator of replication initiation
MKRLMIVLTVLFVINISAFAQMGTGHGGGMMDGG